MPTDSPFENDNKVVPPKQNRRRVSSLPFKNSRVDRPMGSCIRERGSSRGFGKNLGMSRTPVRGALHRLQRKGYPSIFICMVFLVGRHHLEILGATDGP
jgi:hypothetical protein